MPSVTYHHQKAIHKTRGAVPLAGTKYPYQITRLLWTGEIEGFLRSRFIGTVLHVCCGKSQLGDIRVDLFEKDVDVLCDGARLPFPDRSFGTVLCEPPYNGKFRWMHDLLSELVRVAAKRLIFQHWFCPVNRTGQHKKVHVYQLTEAAIVPDLSNHVGELRACLYDPETGKYYIAEESPEAWEMQLRELRYWQPMTYFGRVQLLSIFDRME